MSLLAVLLIKEIPHGTTTNYIIQPVSAKHAKFMFLFRRSSLAWHQKAYGNVIWFLKSYHNWCSASQMICSRISAPDRLFNLRWAPRSSKPRLITASSKLDMRPFLSQQRLWDLCGFWKRFMFLVKSRDLFDYPFALLKIIEIGTVSPQHSIRN